MLSRVCVIPFTKPIISPATDEEQDAFDDIEDMVQNGLLSSSIAKGRVEVAALSKTNAYVCKITSLASLVETILKIAHRRRVASLIREISEFPFILYISNWTTRKIDFPWT